MQFKIAYTLPISKRKIYYTELTNADYFSIIKHIAANDDASIEIMFDELIEQITSVSGHKLFAADKFCLLLDLRSIVLGDYIEFKSNTNAIARLKISDIINVIWPVLSENNFEKSITSDIFSIRIATPRRFITTDLDSLIVNSICSINDGESEYDFSEFSTKEQEIVLKSLPADIFSKIIEHVKECQRVIHDTHIIKSNKTLEIDEIPFKLFDNTMFEFLKAIFSGDLMNFYELQYSLLTKLGISYDHFMKMTPNESKIFINLHSKEIKKQEESKNRNNTPGRFNTQ